MIYLLLFGLLFILAYLELSGIGKKNDDYFFIWVLLFFNLLPAIRYKTGGDWTNYIAYFNSVGTNSTENYELGFFVLNLFFKKVFNNYYIMQFTIQLFEGYTVYRFVKNYKYKIFFLLIYFVFFYQNLEMSMVRQRLALAFLVFAYENLEKKRTVKFLLFVGIAAQFHVTAILFIPALMLARINKLYHKLILVFASLLTITFGRYLVYSILNILVDITCLPNGFKILISRYVSIQQYVMGSSINSGLGFYSRILIWLLIITRSSMNRYNQRIDANMLLMVIFFESISFSFSILQRFSFYYYFFAIKSYDEIIEYVKIKSTSFFYPVFTLLILCYFSLNLVSVVKKKLPDGKPAITLFIPYYSIFTQNDDLSREYRLKRLL